MGQAFRRASGRIKASSPNIEPMASSKPKTVVDRQPPVVGPTDVSKISRAVDIDADGNPKINPDNVLEERDPKYDAILSQMTGRIRSKPGGKLEMGEAAVGERYDRPMPKLRNTKPDSGYEETPAPPGTLNVAQLRQIILLHQGKAADHEGPMDIQQIAEKFRVDVVQVQRIVQFLSMPPEDSSKSENSV